MSLKSSNLHTHNKIGAYTSSSCQVRSFNFLASTYTHLADQYYKACVRRERGYCKIGWSPSSDPDSFKVMMAMIVMMT